MMSSDSPASRLATRLAFWVAGFGVAAWAPLVPFAKHRMQVDDGTLGLLLLCLVLLMVLVALFLTPALLIQYAIKDDFGALFRFSEVFDIIRNHMSDILIAFLVTVAAVFVVSLIGGVLGIIPCLGWIAAFVIGLASGPYVSFVGGHLYGQIAAKVLGNKAGNYYPPTA